MELALNRQTRTELTTIGVLSANGFSVFILEDTDRGLKSSMALSEIASKKVYGKTAIPAGRYEVVLSYSERFKKVLPLLLDVPGFAGIRIHPGNVAADTEGCLLPGLTAGVNAVYDSRKAWTRLMDMIHSIHDKEKIFITIQ